jgi:Predicted membrane protein
MALFTMIMGNGFAAFAVITVGIGYPFLIAQGANAIVVGALGLTAGYCGTLMTPMAANFNIMPAALLETKNKYRIIMTQVPVALIMLVIHIILMYVLAF